MNWLTGKMISRLIKFFIDIVFAIIAAVFVAPILIIAAVIVHLFSPEAPVLFRQKRVGYKGKLFTIYKLRTMSDDRDKKGELLPDEKRLKLWGKIIRTTNIDELTQIANILLGQMSWIGPRPLLPHEMSVMTKEEQILRQSILPGISGWEAVNEGKSTNRREMAEFDLYYVRNWSLWFDIKIFFKTVLIIFLKLRPEDAIRAPKVLAKEPVKPGKKDGV